MIEEMKVDSIISKWVSFTVLVISIALFTPWLAAAGMYLILWAAFISYENEVRHAKYLRDFDKRFPSV